MRVVTRAGGQGGNGDGGGSLPGQSLSGTETEYVITLVTHYMIDVCIIIFFKVCLKS